MYELPRQLRSDTILQQTTTPRHARETFDILSQRASGLHDRSAETSSDVGTRILVIDDDEWIRDILSHVLARSQYHVQAVCGAEEALTLLTSQTFDLILCDMHMRGMTGIDMTNAVTLLYPHIPIILITASRDTDLMRTALRQGAADFIPKPFDAKSIPIIIERNIERRALNRKQVEETRWSQMFSNVQLLAAAIDAKEPFTAQHSRRVARLSRSLAEGMQLPESERQTVDWAAQVHDVGKIAIPDQILLKPGRLTDEEWNVVREHPVKGAQIVGQVSDLRDVASIARSHHERVDGSGYPDGLCGDQIPLLARIISVTDAFEVMTSDRVYHVSVSEEEALIQLQTNAGTQFDADVVAVFQSLPPEARR